MIYYISDLVKPQITSSQDIYTVNEFSPVSFQCSAIGIPIPSITWYRNNIISNETDSRISIKRTEPNPLSSLVFETNQTLTITGVQDNDTDVYSCMASSDIANDSTTFDLIVHCKYAFMTILLNYIIICRCHKTD